MLQVSKLDICLPTDLVQSCAVLRENQLCKFIGTNSNGEFQHSIEVRGKENNVISLELTDLKIWFKDGRFRAEIEQAVKVFHGQEELEGTSNISNGVTKTEPAWPGLFENEANLKENSSTSVETTETETPTLSTHPSLNCKNANRKRSAITTFCTQQQQSKSKISRTVDSSTNKNSLPCNPVSLSVSCDNNMEQAKGETKVHEKQSRSNLDQTSDTLMQSAAEHVYPGSLLDCTAHNVTVATTATRHDSHCEHNAGTDFHDNVSDRDASLNASGRTDTSHIEVSGINSLDQQKDVDVASDVFAAKWECTDCFKHFKTKSGLLRHTRLHTGKYPFFCQECDKGFQDKIILDDHNRLHHGAGVFICPRCDRRLHTLRGLRRHEELHMGNLFSCPECQKTFPSEIYLKRHLLTHSRKYPCELCDNVYTTVQHLKIHMKVHSQDSFMCPFPGCDFITNYETSLKRHAGRHSNTPRFECSKCAQCFQRKDNLKRHEAACKGQSPFVWKFSANV